MIDLTNNRVLVRVINRESYIIRMQRDYDPLNDKRDKNRYVLGVLSLLSYVLCLFKYE
jgi:hypothetical protein